MTMQSHQSPPQPSYGLFRGTFKDAAATIDSEPAAQAALAILGMKSTRDLNQDLCYAYPNDYFDGGILSSLFRGVRGPKRSTEARMCWVVSIFPAPNGFLMSIIVDAETGEVVGGIG